MDDPCDSWDDPKLLAILEDRKSALSKILAHFVRFWHWSSRWQWYSGLFLGAVALVSINEFGPAVALLILSSLSVTSKLTDWNGIGGRPRLTVSLKILGTFGVLAILIVFIAVGMALKDERPWSNAPKAWEDFANARWRPIPEPPKPVNHPTLPPFAHDFSPRPPLPPPRASNRLDSPAEGIQVDVYFEVPQAFIEQIPTDAADPVLSDYHSHPGLSVSSSSNLPNSYKAAALRVTLGRIVPCDPTLGIQTGLTFQISKHPFLWLYIYNHIRSGTCVVEAGFEGPVIVSALTIPIQHAGYRLWFPSNDSHLVTLRTGLTGVQLSELCQGYHPTWKPFAINDSDEKVEMSIGGGNAQWNSAKESTLSAVNQASPRHITLKTYLFVGGPVVVRTFSLAPWGGRGPRDVFSWKRDQYREEKNIYN
jgi:hypothetical protein